MDEILGRLDKSTIEMLTDYQRESYEWSEDKKGAFYWWACGAGKTLGAILWSLRELSRGNRVVIVTKAPTRRQWQYEFMRYTGLEEDDLYILSGRKPGEIPDVPVVITSWSVLLYWHEAILQWGNKTYSIVYDEVHKGKGWQRKEKYVTSSGAIGYRYARNRVGVAALLSRDAVRRLGLTATPIPNRRMDLWGQFDLVVPRLFGTSWHFAHTYCAAKQGQYGGLETHGVSNCEDLKNRVAEYTYTVSYDQMARQLPDKRRELVYLKQADLKRPKGFTALYKQAAGAGAQAKFEIDLMRAAASKNDWVIDKALEVASSGRRVTILTGRRRDVDTLYTQLKLQIDKVRQYHDITLNSAHGGKTLSQRQIAVDVYGKWDKSILVGTTYALGEAIDGLQKTDMVIFAHLPWTPGLVTQAEGRFSRLGGDRAVLLYYLIAEATVDEQIADLLTEKLDQLTGVIDDDQADEVASVLLGDDDESILDNILMK